MKFGVQIEPQFGFSYSDVLNISESAIKNGFTTLWFSDHFMLDKNAIDKELLDPWLLMTALVRDNKNIRVGSLVFCNSYRHPPVHAKMAATLDVLSEGRLEFGIGAGWKQIEYNAYGYNFPDSLTRIEQLAEAVQIIKGIWMNDHFSFKGSHYSTDELISFPKPFQKPHPTVWIGTMYGRKKMLELTAKYGDGINVAWTYTAEQCSKMFTKLDGFAEKHGRNPSEIKRSVGFWSRCFVSEDAMEVAIIEGAEKRNVSVEDYKKRVSSAMWGTPEMLVEKLRAYDELGVSDVILMLPHESEVSQLDMLGTKVIPKL
ncbi:MAG: LLM class flavin-dependent oxidoreductase [Candidatus Thorarchaeota archaeon]|nr:LLM class flavin-dependent oxidoreductase [Candidatus Thorarchaeota archaeon]MCK5238248.1 LLM class flavin-dependent oxidoreductase [Candidatus Thorarchaeota archaeon]